MSKEWRSLIFAVTVLIIIGGVSMMPRIRPMVGVLGKFSADVLFIDPGHGGIDGGSVGRAGICEKNINLKIAKHIKGMAEADGWRVIMSREIDEGVYEKEIIKDRGGEHRRSIRSLKSEDLKNRVKMIEKARPRVSVSIHLNSFKQDPSVRGAQTFYPKGDSSNEVIMESKLLAETIQSSLVNGLDDGSKRVALPRDGILIFKDPAYPIVLVECGFLSNPKEEQLLADSGYQKKIATLIYKGIMEYTGKKPRDPIPIVWGSK
ncbi:MAG: N-acetylmuramoyl-L-alanine amidase [Anaerovoracaceae bacterium]